MLTYHEAKRFYNSFGSRQDKQFYEELAISKMLQYGDFGKARNIFEFGCGTGKLALCLLNNYLSKDSTYIGLDISQTMVDICSDKIKPFCQRAKCEISDGTPKLFIPDHSIDRFIATYVLDLLDENDIAILQENAYRILTSDGYLCLVSLTHGVTLLSKIVEFGWCSLFKLNPKIVGGCRPISIAAHLQKDKWEIMHSSNVVSYGIPSEVLIARKI